MDIKPYGKLLETDFDELARIAAEQSDDRLFSRKEYEAGQAEAFEKGRQEGLQQALQNQEERIASCLESLKANFESLMAQQAAFEETQQKDIAHLSANIVETLLPSLIEKQGQEEIIRIINKALSNHMKSTLLHVNVSPDNFETIQNQVNDMTQNLPNASIEVGQDEKLGPADCTVEWGQGGINRITETLWLEIKEKMTCFLNGESLDDYLSEKTPNHETEIQADQKEEKIDPQEDNVIEEEKKND